MFTMLIQRIVLFLGVVVGSSFSIVPESSIFTKFNSTSPGLNFGLLGNLKSKRQLDDFVFDSGSFEGLGIFSPKTSEKPISYEEGSHEDFSGYVPTSFKVTRSNTPSLGTHGQNHGLSSYPLRESQAVQKSAEAQRDIYSNEDQDSQSITRQTNGAYENQVTTPRFDEFLNQQKYVGTKPTTYSSTDFKPPPVRPIVTSYAPSAATYGVPAQIPTYHYQTQAIYQNPAYKIQFSPQGLKTLQSPVEVYAPLHNHQNQQQQQQQQQQIPLPYQNYRQNQYNNIRFTTAPTVEINGKRMTLPILQLQTEYPKYVQTVKTTPVLYSAESGLQYKTEPGFGVSFDFAKPRNQNHRSGTDAPFLAPQNTGPIQVLPLQTSSSTAQFPRFKGASIAQYPGRSFSKIPNDYQEFKSQPQLHFDPNVNNNPKDSYNPKDLYNPKDSYNPAFNPKSERIKSDVEIIKKKNKKPKAKPPKHDENEDESREDDSEEGYRGEDSYFPKNDDEDADEGPRKNSKDPELESDFVPSKSYPFGEYDNKFNKQKKVSQDAENNDDDDEDETSVDLAAKFRYEAKVEDDEDDDGDNDSSEDEKKSKIKSYDNSSSRYSDEHSDDDDEPHKQTRKEKVTNSKHSSAKKLRARERGSKERHGKKHYKPKSSRYHYKSHSDSDESRSSSDFLKSEPSKKIRHRTYRDKASELTNEPSLLQLAAERKPFRQTRKTKGEVQPNHDPFKFKKRSAFSSGFWDNDAFGMKFENFGDDANRSSYSKEEAEGTGKGQETSQPSSNTQEYTTKQPRNTSTTSARSIMDSFDANNNSSTISPRFPQSRTKRLRVIPDDNIKKSGSRPEIPIN